MLSLDKSRETVLDYGTRQLPVYPDTPEDIACRMRSAGLAVTDVINIENARLIRAAKV